MPDTKTTSLDRLKSFLNELFQFESQDLDFGVYKILHYKRAEIKNFIENLLVSKVKSQLATLTQVEVKETAAKIEELEQDDIIAGWLKVSETEKKTLEKIGKEKIKQYHHYKSILENVQVSAEAESNIYNHLALFFSRYYDKGDFISKRRFGKNAKYVIPYNGEETYFYWANYDQYYIKSSESFQKYAFKITQSAGDLLINFKLTDVSTEQGNVKADDNKYFVLSSKKSPELNAVAAPATLDIFFEYRPLNEEEKKGLTGNNKQELLNELAAANLEKKLKRNIITAKLWERKSGDNQSFLLKNLHRYTRKNNYDFFIHKDLKGFLRRELDFYIKSELIGVEDLYVMETDEHFDRIRTHLKSVKVFKQIADTLIDFLAQIEDFQKKLWEKKKFVLSTHWVITIDRLVSYIGHQSAMPILQEAIKNKKQLAEWVELFGKENVPHGKLAVDHLKVDLHDWRKFPIDTSHFSEEFKENILNVLSEKIDLEEMADGLVIHSDNFHGIEILTNKFSKKINSTYIDPPYNTNASEIIYKNNFRNASWLSLMQDRLIAGKNLLIKDGNICVTIDDVEVNELSWLLKTIFGKEDFAGVVSIRVNPSGRPTESGFAIAHEYALFCKNGGESRIRKLPRTENQLKRYGLKDDLSIYEWRNLRREGSNSNREEGRRQWYPIYGNIKSSSIRVPQMIWNEQKEEWIPKEKPVKDEIIIYPITEDGIEKNWRWSEENVKKDYTQFECRGGNKKPQVYYKFRPNTEGITPLTFWADAKYSATEHGTKVLKELFDVAKFTYSKSIWAVKDCIHVMNNNPNGYILDYFSGSGTTSHAIQLLNKEDNGKRRFVLIEQGGYVYTVIVPRIKKIAYSFDWKDGKPKGNSMNGLGVFFKYQRLEQYEEALENIAFSLPQDAIQQALKFDQYIPKYFLEFETRNSKTLVNTEDMKNPWDYRLKSWDGLTYDNEQAVDMMETFNYLIGLHVQKYYTKQLNNKKYQFILGKNNAEQSVLVIWRSTSNWKLQDYRSDSKALKAALNGFTYDILYINGQAHLDGYQPVEEIFKNKMMGT